MKKGIVLENVTKSYNGVEVLHSVSVNFNYGTVHALVGENGAGKSTMMKILAGVHAPDSGKVYKDGKCINNFTPKYAKKQGIAIIHQELSYISELSVAENIYLGREPRKHTFIDYNRMYAETKSLFKTLGVAIDPRAKMKDLRQASKQIVEIAKAVSVDADVIIMDEPTSALSYHETEKLFQIIKVLLLEEKCIIFISHKLDEIYQISDTISVLRDGSMIGTWPINALDRGTLIYHMVGRTMDKIYPSRHAVIGDTVFEIRELCKEREYRNISLKLREGEILGIAGMVGAGRTETMQSIFGIRSYDSGEIILKGKKIRIRKPSDAIRNGIAYIPEDRKEMGLVLMLGVGRNLSLSSTVELSKVFGGIDTRREQELIEGQINSMSIKVHDTRMSVSRLSGGNQQKVVLGKWLAKNPEILILDEPTKGVDVGAKYEIYSIISDYVKAGNSVIMVSSDMSELIGMSDRIVVFNNGEVAGEIEREEFSQESILHMEISGIGGER